MGQAGRPSRSVLVSHLCILRNTAVVQLATLVLARVVLLPYYITAVLLPANSGDQREFGVRLQLGSERQLTYSNLTTLLHSFDWCWCGGELGLHCLESRTSDLAPVGVAQDPQSSSDRLIPLRKQECLASVHQRMHTLCSPST